MNANPRLQELPLQSSEGRHIRDCLLSMLKPAPAEWVKLERERTGRGMQEIKSIWETVRKEQIEKIMRDLALIRAELL